MTEDQKQCPKQARSHRAMLGRISTRSKTSTMMITSTQMASTQFMRPWHLLRSTGMNITLGTMISHHQLQLLEDFHSSNRRATQLLNQRLNQLKVMSLLKVKMLEVILQRRSLKPFRLLRKKLSKANRVNKMILILVNLASFCVPFEGVRTSFPRVLHVSTMRQHRLWNLLSAMRRNRMISQSASRRWKRNKMLLLLQKILRRLINSSVRLMLLEGLLTKLIAGNYI
mmetsp:Transcript_16323/g.31676  ORF Transcript_16323/g.31676 Transcript_16323/m.31676 type:complete len:227 (-) Transcript_16323:1851-2531(-)